MRGPAGEQSEHQVGATGLAPEVVERYDMGVLEPGDEPRFGVEAADEVRRVGHVGPDRLDGDEPFGPGLGRRVHPPEGALADHVVQDVTT